jgi:hypothetical protein
MEEKRLSKELGSPVPARFPTTLVIPPGLLGDRGGVDRPADCLPPALSGSPSEKFEAVLLNLKLPSGEGVLLAWRAGVGVKRWFQLGGGPSVLSSGSGLEPANAPGDDDPEGEGWSLGVATSPSMRLLTLRGDSGW